MSEVNKSFKTNPAEGNYAYRKRDSQECENDASLRDRSEELQGTDYSTIRDPVKDTVFCVINESSTIRDPVKDAAFCVVNESPDITDEEAFINQNQREAHTGYEKVIFNFRFLSYQTSDALNKTSSIRA